MSKAATPGKILPSSISSDAPPPVDICDILSTNLAALTAATESPPPIIVIPPLPKDSYNYINIYYINIAHKQYIIVLYFNS